MGTESEKPERELTDQSLAGERHAADRVLEHHRRQVEAKVDSDLARARVANEEVRYRSRSQTDAEVTRTLPPHDRAQLEAERRLHDEALEHERAVADAKLKAERSARRRAIAELLSAERDQTNEDLRVERERADEQVDARDDALASISHELRNLIGIVSMSAETMLRRTRIETCNRELDDVDARRISRSSQRMLRLVTDLLDVARIGYGRLSIDKKPSNVDLLLEDIREAFTPVAHAKSISLDVNSKVGPATVWLDSDRIYQVLANLVANAIKFTLAGGHVEVEAHRDDDELRFSVRDTGPGIAESDRSAIFDRFYQLPNQRSGGHGLGLYICRAVVDAHDGRIWVDGVVGRGSVFHVALPVA
ncbi:MAG: HAMP domain-containing histidine kinase [Labilithrix sp.]|nr:HAMP domain-containing histidine kinase [Labilithrix sp.]